MKSVSELERELAEAKERVRLEKEQCTSCGGKGWFSDSTYDRSGEDVSCGRCHGTGFPAKRVAEIIQDAFSPYRKAVGVTQPPPSRALVSPIPSAGKGGSGE